ncbi:MAG: MmgE/PrpD family protein [Chloroflexota bacterium]
MSHASPVAERLADFTSAFRLHDAPESVSSRMVRHIADTMACALGGAFDADSAAVSSVLEEARRFAYPAEATILGVGERIERRAAAMANATFARHLDANDIYLGKPGRFAGGGHFSDVLPALLSVAEARDAGGRAFLETAIVAYEVQGALADAYLWMTQGLHTVSQVSIAAAAGTARLLNLPRTETSHAIALAISGGMILQSWLKPSAQVPTVKSVAAGLAAERGILCAQLASRGATGALDAIETMVSQWPADFIPDAFDFPGQEWRTPQNAIKSAPAQIFTQAVVQCGEQLFEQGLRLDAVREITVRSNNGACGRVQGAPEAFRPETREAADHSTPFVLAMTLRDGSVTLASYDRQQWLDPAIRAAMDRMSLIIDPEWDARFEAGQFGAEVDAVDVYGSRYRARVDQFVGHPDNPLSDSRLIAKMRGLIEGEARFPADRADQIFKACLALPEAPSLRPLLESCVPNRT